MTVKELHRRLTSLINTGNGEEIILAWCRFATNEYKEVTIITELGHGFLIN
jgi:hypothetical protein